MAHPTSPIPHPTSSAAVIFDLDGTLTVPFLDFDLIRREMNVPGGPILEAMARMPPACRQQAEAILERHERRAALESTLRPGAAETLDVCRARGFRLGLATRNARRWVELTLQRHGLTFEAVRCRDDGPIKPGADPVLHLCAALGCDPRSSWVVGDYLFDLQSGRAAGCRCVLMLGDADLPAYADQADFVIHRLPDLLPLLDLRR